MYVLHGHTNLKDIYVTVTRKGASWVSYCEIYFSRFLNREFYDESRNINMLVGS